MSKLQDRMRENARTKHRLITLRKIMDILDEVPDDPMFDGPRNSIAAAIVLMEESHD